MDRGLLRLCSKNVRVAHGNAVWRCGTLLEDMSLRRQRLILVHKHARIFGDARVGLGRGGNGRDDEFGEHRLAGVGGVGWLLRAGSCPEIIFGGAAFRLSSLVLGVRRTCLGMRSLAQLVPPGCIVY